MTIDMQIGSYVDACLTDEPGKVDSFIESHPECFTKSGKLRSEFIKASEVVHRIQQEPMMMKYLGGQHQVILTGKIHGAPFKGKIDSYHPGKAIVDLKVMRDFRPIWDAESREKVPWWMYWKYDIQAAIYQALEGNRLPVYLAAATKEDPPDVMLAQIPQERIDYQLEQMEWLIDRIVSLKEGKESPKRCGNCPYCRATKRIHSIEMLEVDL